MDCRAVNKSRWSARNTKMRPPKQIQMSIELLFSLTALLLFVIAESRTKKVVIHVPLKVKKIKHTHTVYKTIHHHHHQHDPHLDHALSPSEEHEHFHHMHIHEEPLSGQHSQPGIGIPEFLPDVPLDVPLDLPDIPRDKVLPNRHIIPLYRRT